MSGTLVRRCLTSFFYKVVEKLRRCQVHVTRLQSCTEPKGYKTHGFTKMVAAIRGS